MNTISISYLHRGILKIRAATLDDLLHEVYRRLLHSGKVVTPSSGETLETSGVLLELTNPRARISRTETRHRLFSCLGELLWYLAGDDTDKFIRYYIPDYPNRGGGETLPDAYGPRLRGKRDLLRWAVQML